MVTQVSAPSAKSHTQGNETVQPRSIADLSLAYEEYKKEMQKVEGVAQRGEAGELVLQRIKELEELFATVTSSEIKELSMYMNDSEALRKITEIASINADHVRFGDLGGTLPMDGFLNAVKQYMNPDFIHENEQISMNSSEDMNTRFNSFNWGKLGSLFYSKGNTPVPSYFLYGPLATQRRRATQRTRTVDDTVGLTAKTAEKVTISDLQDETEQTTSDMVKTVYGVLDDRDPDNRVNLYRYFINPHSFAQSVENFFYTSFLVRDGKLKVDAGPDNEPYVEIASAEDIQNRQSAGTPLSHHIASFDFSSWKALIQKYNITESYIPHRQNEEDMVSDEEDQVADENSGTDVDI